MSGLRHQIHVGARTNPSQPLIAGGRFYVQLCADDEGCTLGAITAYALADGHGVGSQPRTELMTYAFGSFFSMTTRPTNDGEIVDGAQGWLTRWKPDLSDASWTDGAPSWHDASAHYTGMLADEERLYVQWTDSLVAYRGNPDGSSSGACVFAGSGDDGPIHFAFFTAAVARGRVFATNGDTLYAFDPTQVADGRCHAVATRVIPGEQLSFVSISGRVVVVDAGSKLIAFDADTLEEKWRIPHQGRTFPSLAISGGRVFETTSSGDLRALDLETGVIASQVHVTSAFLSEPSVGGDLVYVHGETLAAFSTSCGTGGQTCSPLWSARAAGSSPAAIAAGHVIVSSGAGIDVFSLP